MAQINLSGMGVALITPFKEDGNIDTTALSNLVDNVVKEGADYLVVLGTTAETPTLKSREREIVKHCVRDSNSHRVPMVLGLGGFCTAEVASELASANTEGFEAILSVVPFYNKPSQAGIEAHYRVLAQASKLPLIAYNVPGRTGVNMLPETIIKLADTEPNIIAVKEASGNLRQIDEIIRKAPEGFQVISGDDSLTFPMMLMGAKGVISVAGNVIPGKFGKMVHSIMEGNYGLANSMHNSFHDIYELLFKDGNPAGVKAALASMGQIENVLRLPLVKATTRTFEEIKSALEALAK